MFTQGYRQKPNANTMQQQFTLQSQLQSNQKKAFSQNVGFQTQDKSNESFTQMMSTKKQNEDINRSFRQPQFGQTGFPQQLLYEESVMTPYQDNQQSQMCEVFRIVEQLQSFVVQKMNDFTQTMQEHEKLIKPLQEQQTQIGSLLTQSEVVLQQLQNVFNKAETTMKKKQPKGYKENNTNLSGVQQLLERLDCKLNDIQTEFNQIGEQNNRFQLQMMEIVNQDKLDNNDQLQRVLIEMQNTKRSLSKRIKK